MPILPFHRRAVLGLCLALVCASSANAEMAEVSAPGGVALGGYDAVAYFTQGRAVKGSKAHMLKWRGVMWYFASAENMEAFEMNAAGYAPQYGGYCAYAAATGAMGVADPLFFSIVDGRLFLNNSETLRAAWERNAKTYIARADANWPSLIGR